MATVDTQNRTDLSPAKAEFAQDMRLLSSTSGVGPSGSYQRLENVVAAVQPTALIGAAAVGGAFKQAVVEALVQVGLASSCMAVLFIFCALTKLFRYACPQKPGLLRAD